MTGRPPADDNCCGELCRKLLEKCTTQGLKVIDTHSSSGDVNGHAIYSRGGWLLRERLVLVEHCPARDEVHMDSLVVDTQCSELEAMMLDFARGWKKSFPWWKVSVNYANKLYTCY